MGRRKTSTDDDGDERQGPPGFFGTLWRLALVGTLLYGVAGLVGYGVVYKYVKTPEVEAPDLLTLDQAEALRRASDLGFATRIAAHERSEIFPTGSVIAQNPQPGTWIKNGATVTLTVAE